jgi:hypothetical protein
MFVPLLRIAGTQILEGALCSVLRHPRDFAMVQTAHVVHHIPGRARLRIPAKRHNHNFFEDVKRRLGQLDSVSHVSVNPASASVLVHYRGGIDQLLAEAAIKGLNEILDISEDLPPIIPAAAKMAQQLIQIDRQITELSGGGLDGRSAVLIGLAVAAIMQLFRGEIFGPAIPLIWYAAQAIGGGMKMESPTAPPALASS